MTDPLAILLSFGYVFLILGVAEGLRRALRLDAEFTRKVVHIGVGMWAFGTAALFTSSWAALVPPAAFVAINYISYRRNLFRSMESEDKSNLGTILFPIAFVVMIVVFFSQSKPLFVASLMPLTWGDSFAAIVGRRWGRRPYSVGGSTRTWEGTLTMLVLSFASVVAAFLVFGWPADVAIFLAAPVALVSTVAEAISPSGLDNLTVPGAFVLLWVLIRAVLLNVVD